MFETNSSSSHALVVSRNPNEFLSSNKMKFRFKIRTFEFGRNFGIYTDAPHKFAYVFQFLTSMISMPDLEDSLPKKTPKKIYDQKKKELKARFQRLSSLLQLVSSQLEKRTNILLDFSDLEVLQDGTLACYSNVPSDDIFLNVGNGVQIDSQLDEHFEISNSAKIINDILDSNTPITITKLSRDFKGNQIVILTEAGCVLVRCFSNMLDFAFDENSIIMTSDDSGFSDTDYGKMICDYTSMNKGHCIISWLC